MERKNFKNVTLDFQVRAFVEMKRIPTRDWNCFNRAIIWVFFFLKLIKCILHLIENFQYTLSHHIPGPASRGLLGRRQASGWDSFSECAQRHRVLQQEIPQHLGTRKTRKIVLALLNHLKSYFFISSSPTFSITVLFSNKWWTFQSFILIFSMEKYLSRKFPRILILFSCYISLLN